MNAHKQYNFSSLFVFQEDIFYLDFLALCGRNFFKCTVTMDQSDTRHTPSLCQSEVDLPQLHVKQPDQ